MTVNTNPVMNLVQTLITQSDLLTQQAESTQRAQEIEHQAHREHMVAQSQKIEELKQVIDQSNQQKTLLQSRVSALEELVGTQNTVIASLRAEQEETRRALRELQQMFEGHSHIYRERVTYSPGYGRTSTYDKKIAQKIWPFET